jgi:murein DD-endopeptidase MepM/ murein hydrolase activator NlpD
MTANSKKSGGAILIGLTVLSACFVALGLAVGFFAYEAKRHLVEKKQLEAQVQMVNDYLGRMEESMVSMQDYRENIEDLARSPMNDRKASSEVLEENLSRFIDSYREKSELSNKDRPVSERLATLKDSTAQMEHTLRTLSTVLGHSKEFLGAIPSITPTAGWVTSSFGARQSPFDGRQVMHFGIDVGAPEGSPVFATADGEVLFAGSSKTFGNIVILEHAYNVVTKYAHNSQLMVREGQKIRRGQKIALVGNTGRSTGPHLHYEVWVNGRPVDPTNYLIDRSQELSIASMPNPSQRQMGGEEDMDVKFASSLMRAAPTAVSTVAMNLPAESNKSSLRKLTKNEPVNWKKTAGFGLVSFGCLLFVMLFGYLMVSRANRDLLLAQPIMNNQRR